MAKLAKFERSSLELGVLIKINFKSIGKKVDGEIYKTLKGLVVVRYFD